MASGGVASRFVSRLPWALTLPSISAPLRSRFGIDLRFDFYTTEDLATILLRAAKIEGIAIDDDAAFKLAGCARGTPRPWTTSTR